MSLFSVLMLIRCEGGDLSIFLSGLMKDVDKIKMMSGEKTREEERETQTLTPY